MVSGGSVVCHFWRFPSGPTPFGPTYRWSVAFDTSHYLQIGAVETDRTFCSGIARRLRSAITATGATVVRPGICHDREHGESVRRT